MQRRAFLAAIALALVAPTAQAATIDRFDKTTNDGVFTLTPEQAALLGAPEADRIAFFRVREGRSVRFRAGDAFDARTLGASVRSGRENVIAFVNGAADGLRYEGAPYERLGRVVIESDANSFSRGVAFLFSADDGPIVFAGGATFSGDQTRGAFALPAPAVEAAPAPVPAPATLPLMAAGLGGLVLVRKWRRAGRRYLTTSKITSLRRRKPGVKGSL